LATSRPLHTIEKEQINDSLETTDDTPWYMRQEESSELTTPVFRAEKPEIPLESPESLELIIESMIDLGLADFKVFDIRGRDDIPMSSMAEFCIVCEGKSEKHIQNATQEVITKLKHDFSVQPYVEGLIRPNSSMKMKKRLKMKKPVNDFGVGVNSWIMVDSQTGVFLNLLTPERRRMLNLEYLWCKPEERSQYERKPEISHEEKDDSIFAGIFRRYYSTRAEEIPLETKALQSFQIGDEEAFRSLSTYIREDPDVSLKVLQGIVQALQESDIQETLSLDPEFNKFVQCFNKAFPLTPTREHWSQRYKLMEIFHNLFPDLFIARVLSTNLLLQAGSGIEIQESQLRQLVQSLTKSLYYNPPNQVLPPGKITYFANEKSNALFNVLRAYGSINRDPLPDDLVLGILKLYTQQHLYTKTDEVIPLSGVFDVILDVFSQRYPSLEIIEFVLVSYIKANQPKSFWSYWTNLYQYSATESEVIIDGRPWELLSDVLVHNYHEKVVGIFLNNELRFFIDNEFTMTPAMKENVLTLLKRYHTTGEVYSELRL
jgi:ribosomal silencing factor RsfS